MLASILDLFFPRNCPVCRNPSDRPGRYICSDCLNRVPLLPPDDNLPAAMHFEGYGRKLILDFKFRQKLFLLEDLTDFLEAAALAHYNVPSVDVVVPMPVPFWRRLSRGYNQSGLLARALARRIDRACRPDLLARRGFPRQQAMLDYEARRENVKGTFRVPARKAGYLRSRTVLLVDDIRTTGATCDEAVSALKAAGAAKVLVLTLAQAGD